jgi:phospholipid/cholesterol/gamma-HCH transport system ATP-binding protein
MGLTSIFVSHELEQTFAIADHVIILANGRVASQGTPQEVLKSTDPLVYQYVNALSEGPVRFHYPALSVEADFGPDPDSEQQKQVGVTR